MKENVYFMHILKQRDTLICTLRRREGCVRKMKILKVMGVCVVTTVMIMLFLHGLDYVFSNDTTSWSRIEMHELYGQEDIDSLFLGASHVYSGINPTIADTVWGQNTFNCSTSAQRIDTSYLLLKEANRVADIDTCYLEISVNGVTKGLEEGTLLEVCRVSDYMRPSWNKFSYLLTAIQPQDLINAFCRARRNWKSVYSLSTMRETVSQKWTAAYRNYEYIKVEAGKYAGKGFVRFQEEFKNVGARVRQPIKENLVNEEFRYYFQKIAQYCQENSIKLVCFSAPLPEYTLESFGNYDVYYTQAKELCEENNVSFYDFNLTNPSILTMKDSDFRDSTHLNEVGAERFTRVLADFFAGKIEEKELFCTSYEAKKEYLPKRFIGLIMRRDASGEFCKIRSVTTKKDKFKFEVYYEDENGECTLLQEKSRNRKIALPSAEKVNIKVCVYDSRDNEVGSFNKSV